MKLNTKGIHSYQYLPFIAMLLLTTDVASSLIAYKFIQLGFIETSAAVFVAILGYPISDIIAEVYGFTVLKRIIWFRLICDYIFGIFLAYGLWVPAIAAWHLQSDYNAVFGHYLRLVISGTLGLIISSIVNGYLISKWKILLKGKVFWLRSIGSTLIAVICNDILVLILSFEGFVRLKTLLIFVGWTFTITIIFISLVSPISAFFCRLVKRMEGVDVYEKTLSWNPFQLKQNV